METEASEAAAVNPSLKREREEGAAATATVMETEASEAAAVNPSLKREREEGDGSAAGAAGEEAEEAAAKKQKVGGEAKDEGEGEGKPVKLGPKEFASAVEMFDFFFALLRSWAPHLEINKYEHMVLEDLLKKGHAEPNKKIGPGIEAFEIRNHPVWQSRCFFVRRVDGSADDFSFRKCVDSILPLPEDMKISNKSSDGKKAGGHYKGAWGRRGRGGGRCGRGRRGN